MQNGRSSRYAGIWRTVFIAALSAFTLLGCVEPGEFHPVPYNESQDDPDDNLVRVFSRGKIAPENYDVISEVTGHSCQTRQYGASASEREALLLLRREAYAVGADGIVDLQCRVRGYGLSLSSNCWTEAECRGLAIKVNPTTAGTADSGGKSGSGFIVNSDGYLLTNAHVVEGCTTFNGQVGHDRSPLTVIKVDPVNDLAVLKMAEGTTAVATFRDGERVRAGEGVVAVGFPLQHVLAEQINVTSGVVSALAGLHNDARRLQITVPVQPGNSGGPLIDSSGNVVGVIVSSLNALRMLQVTGSLSENVNFAIKAEVARTFLEGLDIEYRLAGPGRVMGAADIGDAAKAYTVFITCK
ncbi:S1 family peptidase [Rhodospirillaceae bacterium SYSU D60014]|uniref:S1C family serine protease n=1 Tax=Virgifigura deserti TaxID=2268457 RepID=UPI000E669825